MDTRISLDKKELVRAIQEIDTVETEVDIIADVIGTMVGDPVAAGRLAYDMVALPARIKDKIFLRKMARFLKGLYSLDESLAFCEVFFGNEDNKEAYAIRIVDIIDKINSEEIVDYVVNAGRALGNGLIDREKFFRICYALKESMPEDLLYLKKHVFDEAAIEGNDKVFGLLKQGLVIQAGINSNNGINNQYYGISNLGIDVDRYALSLDDEDHWERHKKFQNKTPLLHGIISDSDWEKIENIF